MEKIQDQSLENWVLDHAAAGQMKLFFAINGDISMENGDGMQVFYEVPVRGKRVCVLHPDQLTPVARICHESGVQMVQVIL